MPASTEQKVDFLLKKIGYSASKTGGVEGSSGTVDGTKKKPSEEAIPSPLIVPSTSLWSDSVSIPATPPGSDTFPVKVYATASAYRLTVDNSVSESRSFIARSTYGNHTSSIDGNWIDSQFGADYAVRVFKGDPNSSGVELSQAGATGNDTWFFDYSSGILNFTGTDNHASLGVTDTNIYILGYRYTGGVGAKPPSGIGTFSSLYVTGISTFVGVVDINGGGQANTFKVEDLTAGRVVLAGTGGEIEDSGNLTFDANSNLTVTGGVKVTGITTLGSVGISTGLISGPATMYIDPATVGDDTGLLVVKGNLQVDGTQTTVNSSTMTVTDKNIVVAQGSANDAASDGAGITVDAGSDTDKTWNWVDATDAWTSSENIQIAAGKQLGFADDTDTYIDRPAADTIKFTTGGSERLRINTDGNTKITGALNVTGLSTFTGAIDANGDLDVDGHTNLDNISVAGVSTFGGTIVANGDVNLGNSASDDITLTGRITSDIIPSPNITRDLGSSSLRWDNFWVQDINSTGIVASGVITATTELNSPLVGVGTDDPATDIQVRKAGGAQIRVTSDTDAAIVSVGRVAGAGNGTNAAFRYGNNAVAFPYSNSNAVDIINYDIGNVNFYLSVGNAGNAQGDFHWHKGGNTSRLMTLTNSGNLGIGITNPTHKLNVVGTSSFGGNSSFSGNVTIGGNLSISGSFNSNLTGNVTGNLTGNVNATSGLSTFYDVKVTRLLGVGVDADTNIPFKVNIAPGSRFSVQGQGKIGLGTDTPRAGVDFADASGGDETKRFMVPPSLGTVGINSLTAIPAGAVIYNTATNKLQVYNGSAWQNCN